MKTIAITIDEAMLQRVDRMAANRSELIRAAVKEYLDRLERAAAEEHEAAVFRRHRTRLERDARAAVVEQAES